MTDIDEDLLATAYVFSTSSDKVFLVKGNDPDEAERFLKELIDWDEQKDDRLYYEGKLNSWQQTLRRDGVALLNP